MLIAIKSQGMRTLVPYLRTGHHDPARGFGRLQKSAAVEGGEYVASYFDFVLFGSGETIGSSVLFDERSVVDIASMLRVRLVFATEDVRRCWSINHSR